MRLIRGRSVLRIEGEAGRSRLEDHPGPGGLAGAQGAAGLLVLGIDVDGAELGSLRRTGPGVDVPDAARSQRVEGKVALAYEEPVGHVQCEEEVREGLEEAARPGRMAKRAAAMGLMGGPTCCALEQVGGPSEVLAVLRVVPPVVAGVEVQEAGLKILGRPELSLEASEMRCRRLHATVLFAVGPSGVQAQPEAEAPLPQRPRRLGAVGRCLPEIGQ